MHKLLVNRPEIIAQTGMKKENKTVSIGGKQVNVTVILTQKPDQETWFSDECSITGMAAVKANGAFVLEPLDFGSASGTE